jgi:hypothetical protein
LPKHPDRSHLADAIRFMDLIDVADEELPAARATVEQAKEAALTAQMELDKHQQWLGQHQQLYKKAVSGCERRRKRQVFIAACKDTARLPIDLLNSAWSSLFNAGRRRSLRSKLKDRLRELDHPSVVKPGKQLQERIEAMDRSRR